MVANNASVCQVQDLKIVVTSLSIRGLIQQKCLLACQLLSIITINSPYPSIPLYRLKYSCQIAYRCSLALQLAKNSSLSSEEIAQHLFTQLTVSDSHSLSLSQLIFRVELTAPAWIDFYLSDLSLAVWLQEFPRLFLPNSLSRSQLPEKSLLDSDQLNLFPFHYTHARCCALLRLGHQDQLIQLQNQDFNSLYWLWSTPNPIPWRKNHQEHGLNIIHQAEYTLIIRIMLVIDDLETISPLNLLPLIKQLMAAFWEFERYCRIWGEVKENHPQLAQARLGLIAITQYLLCYLLQDKLQVLAIAEL